jgi:hypothetical protein
MGQTAVLAVRRKSRYGVFIALKNPLFSAGSEPAKFGPMASTLTTRPPRVNMFENEVRRAMFGSKRQQKRGHLITQHNLHHMKQMYNLLLLLLRCV